MTQLYLHPLIEDYFVEYDLAEVLASPTDGGPSDLRRRVMQDYAAEKVILLRGVRIDYDRRFVAGLDFPSAWAFKKFQSRSVERKQLFWSSRAKREVCRALFGNDLGRYLKFEREVRAVNGGLRRVLGELLRHHRPAQTDFVWRCTETRVENLHFDVDEGAAGFEAVRLYFNMDDIPRIWQTSHPLSRLFAGYRAELGLDALAQGPPEQLLSVISRRLFGNWALRGREQFPRHVAMFEPEDIWLCDGRAVPHQVIYGRRVVSSFYRLDNAALPAWHPSLSQKLAAWSRGAPAPAAAGLEGLTPPFPPEGPPTSGPSGGLKTNWEANTVGTIGPKLVRF